MACMPGCPPPAYYPPPPPPGGAAYYPQGPPAPYGAPAQPAIIPVPVMCAPPAPAPAAAPAASSSAAAASASAASGQQAQQQQSSTSVVVVGMGDKNGKVYEHYYYAMCLACIVFWCCNPLCGLIAFFLAMMAEETGILEDSRRFAKMSLCASFLGVCGGIVLMIILVAVFVSGGGTVAGMTGAGAVGVVAGANAESNPGPGGPMPQDDAGHGMASYVTGGPTAAGRYPGMNTMQFAASHREHAVRRAQRVLHPVVKQAAPSVRQRDRQVPFQQPIDVPRSDPQVSQIRYNYDKLSVDLQ